MPRKPTARVDRRLARRRAERDLPGIARELRDALERLASTPAERMLVRRADEVLSVLPPPAGYTNARAHVLGNRGPEAAYRDA